jgi:hypothetical protein
LGRGSEKTFYYGKDFGGAISDSGIFSGGVVMGCYGINDQQKIEEQMKKFDFENNVLILLDERPVYPDTSEAGMNRYYTTASAARAGGVKTILTIIDPAKQQRLEKGEHIFENSPAARSTETFDTQKRLFRPGAPQKSQKYLPLVRIDISHEMASAILGISKEEIAEMFNRSKKGGQENAREISGARINLNVNLQSDKVSANNVIAVIEGSDKSLKNEYIVICAHYDHLGIMEGKVYPGADDNGSGTVALMEVAEALVKERPKRSVIIAWLTGEERGDIGSHYFINNSPVPQEKIDACLNMDMISRNPVDSLFLLGSDMMSSELDKSIRKVNEKYHIGFGFNYKYSNTKHPLHLYYRSDHYPFTRYGIPSTFFFSGLHPDYHSPRDVVSMVEFDKMAKVAKLVYLTAYDIGNKKALLKLDVNRTVKSRGKQNISNPTLF